MRYLISIVKRIEARHRLTLSSLLSMALHALAIIAIGGYAKSGALQQKGSQISQRTMSVTLASTPKVKIGNEPIRATPPDLLPPIDANRKNTELEDSIAHPAQNATNGGVQLVASPLAVSTYLTAKQLDIRPIVKSLVNVEVEGLAKFLEGGAIRLSIWINDTGTADAVTVDASTMPDEITERVRLQFAEALYLPGEKNGQKVKSIKKIEITYPPLAAVKPLIPVRTDSR